MTTPVNVTNQTRGSYLDIHDYKLASKTGTDQYRAENEARRKASNTLYLADVDDGLILIKEGTVLGKTMTNAELEAKRAAEGQLTKDENNIVGNYIRVILRDLDGTPVENVEDMMRLDVLKVDKEEYNEENYEFDD